MEQSLPHLNETWEKWQKNVFVDYFFVLVSFRNTSIVVLVRTSCQLVYLFIIVLGQVLNLFFTIVSFIDNHNLYVSIIYSHAAYSKCLVLLISY